MSILSEILALRYNKKLSSEEIELELDRLWAEYDLQTDRLARKEVKTGLITG